jgi:hypothetical protein
MHQQQEGLVIRRSGTGLKAAQLGQELLSELGSGSIRARISA